MHRGFGRFNDYDDDWNDGPIRPPMNDNFGGPRGFRNNRYDDAYGDYMGGYPPSGGGFGPPSNFGPPPNFGGPLGPPGPPGPFGPPGPSGPSGPPGPSQTFFLGRGFGPDGPPMRRTARDEKVVKYLIRCGVAKEHLKNLPRDLLALIEPEYCGLCGQNFESFAISRVHYVSKNHLKNQKKWISNQTESNFFEGPRETPLKSRELYCELCDVHITSKSHSDAHYAGRPHRSIVEGRRPPKNPFLLQPGMQRRVNQLIRREKKSLKSLEENVEPAEKTQEAKPIQPELYCEICKTSVSCSEQMTMHMNGKKHLSKEKRHIFMMMKGGADNENAEYGEEEYDEEEGEDEGNANAGDNEDAGDGGNDDWANGSGNWDEPADDANAEKVGEP